MFICLEHTLTIEVCRIVPSTSNKHTGRCQFNYLANFHCDHELLNLASPFYVADKRVEFAAEVRKYSRDGKVLTLVESFRVKKINISALTFFFSVIGAISGFSVDGEVAVHHW